VYTRLGSLYLDSIVDSATVASPGLVNRVPEPNETGALESGAIYLTVVDTGAAGLIANATTVTVEEKTPLDVVVSTVVAWNGVAFHATYVAASSFTAATSDGAGPNDEHRIILRRSTAFGSLNKITITVHASTADPLVLDTSYYFHVRDYVAPGWLVDPNIPPIASRGLKQIVLNFNEPVAQGTGVVGDAARVRRIYGAALVTANTLYTPIDTFEADDVGLYLAIDGAAVPINNRTYRVATYVDARNVVLTDVQGGAIVGTVETFPSSVVVSIGPYALEGVSDGITPVFAPVIVAARTGLTAAQVLLDLHAELSPGGNYKFSTHKVDDLFGNRLLNDDPAFVAEVASAPPGRVFDLVASMPPHNLSEDYTHDLERLLRSIQDVASVLLSDVDKFAEIVDIDLAPASFLDALLYHLGNPFTFAAGLTEAQKRMLLDVLVEIYQRNGTEAGMEAVLSFFLGVVIDIQAYELGAVWSLGESELGDDTYLGPGTAFLHYAFEAVSPTALTQAQRDRLRDIVNYMKPAHTHFMRIVEP